MSKEIILTAAAALAIKHGYRNIKRADIAERCNCATGTISYHFSTMQNLRECLMRWAVDTGHAHIVGQGLADRHPFAMRAPDALKTRALRLLAAT